MRYKRLAIAAFLLAALVLLSGCTQTTVDASKQQDPSPQQSPEPVTLTVTGGWPDFRALDLLAKDFTALYPNCTIEYEYLQDYYVALEKRVTGEDPVDLFITTNIQAGSTLLPSAVDLLKAEGLDLSNTFDGLIQNFMLRSETGDASQLFAIPLGAEMRGMYVNKTLLDTLGIKIPTDQASLLAACEKLKEKGYTPFHGNPSRFAQHLLYPWVCNLIANADDPKATYEMVNSRKPGCMDLFLEPLNLLYTLIEKGYYDYKTAQTEKNLFVESTDEAYARNFLNVVKQGEEYVKLDDVGQVAFMPFAISLESVLEKTKDDYHSEIEYIFIPAPVSSEGGFVYLSPAHGIAICKNSKNMEWSIKLMDFLFQPENNKKFSQAFNTIPNTKEALAYIRDRFDVSDKAISELGQVTFDYNFYGIITETMIDISKANNPKYMQDDGNGNLSYYPLEHFLNTLKENLEQP